MILDGENMFYQEKALASSLTSDVIAVGIGESSVPMHLIAALDGADGKTTLTLKTSATAAFTSSETLGTYTAPFAGFVPRGNKGFLRLDASSTATKGKITAGLVYDDNVSL